MPLAAVVRKLSAPLSRRRRVGVFGVVACSLRQSKLRKSVRIAASVIGLACAGAATAHAEPVGFRLSGGGALALGGYQQREFGPGADLSTAVEYQAFDRLGVGMQLDGFLLSDGADPSDAELANNNGASMAALLVGLNLRALQGVWIGAAGGAGITGGRFRPVMSATLGYALSPEFPTGVAWGPMFKWVHLFQPDSAVRPEDANVVVAGLHIAFGGSPGGHTRPGAMMVEDE